MPDWLKGSLKGRTTAGDDLWNEFKDMGPREVLGQNDTERQAFEDFVGRADQSQDRSDAAYDGLEGMDPNGGLNFWGEAADAGNFGEKLGNMGNFDHGYAPGEFESGYEARDDFDGGYQPGEVGADYDAEKGAYSGDRLTGLLDGKDFGLDYTDSVVDTTLENMDRNERRQELARQSQQASTGGISNTRSAVADAVAGGENSRARAEMEAKLRDSGQRFETDSLFKQADALDSSDRFKSTDQREAERFRTEQMLKEQGMSDEQARFLSEQNLQEQGMTEDSSRFAAEMALKEAGMSDEAARALGQMNLSQDELIQKAAEFGINFDKSMLDDAMSAFTGDRAFDMDRRTMMNDFSNQGLRQDMAIFDIFNSFGKEGRMLDQAQSDAPRDNAGWLANYLSGTNLGGTMPTGTTQTNTTPGNSGLQNALGIGTSLAGMFMGSDERIKEDVETPDETALDKLDKLDTGVQEYKYKDGFGHVTGRTSGLMAQDLEKAGIQGAVVEIDGVKHVDPYPVLATVVEAVRELNAERRAG